jgi:hypothetical protein
MLGANRAIHPPSAPKIDGAYHVGVCVSRQFQDLESDGPDRERPTSMLKSLHLARAGEEVADVSEMAWHHLPLPSRPVSVSRSP